MGTPANSGSIYDALGDLGGLLVSGHIRHNFNKDSTILDVGAGWGKYHRLLPEYTMDAVEIWEPYIIEDKLEEQYNQVIKIDICDLHEVYYDVIIMGDVLEHIEEDRAIPLIERLKRSCKQLYVITPFEYHQGEVNGNKYEIHLQDKLTDESIRRLYSLTLLAKDDIKGVYIK